MENDSVDYNIWRLTVGIALSMVRNDELTMENDLELIRCVYSYSSLLYAYTSLLYE